MIAYNFKPDFAANVTSGAKALTLRRFRKPPSRHAFVGEPIGLWTGLRTKAARRVAVGLVTVRALVRFDAGGLRTVSELRLANPAVFQSGRLQAELLNCESDAFAVRDGFVNWASAWAWHDAHRTDAEKETGAQALVRELVAWAPITEEQAAALENGSANAEDAA